MIELSRLPGARRMADFASLRKSLLLVIRIVGVVVLRKVTRHAGRLCQIVVAVDMAVRTGSRWNRVQSRKRPSGGRVIEFAIGPGNRIVATRATRGEISPDVIDRSLRVIEIVLVTGHASRHRDVVVAIDVAIGARAWRNGVRAS